MKTTPYSYQPVQERGTLWCFLLALFMHLLLGILLYYGVHWQSSPPVGVEAELWDAIPETKTALPEPVVTPRPAPAARPKEEEEADIALQRQKHRQAVAAARAQARKQADLRARQAREAAERQEAARKDAQRKEDADAQAKRGAAADALRRGELERLEALAGRAVAGTGAGGTASPGYSDRLRRRVKPNIIFTKDVAGNPAAVVAVRLAPDGSLLSARLTKSSGNSAWDSAVLRAVERSDPLPRDENGIAPASLTITFKPKD
ncbi:energy transducer TonB [Cupriavidus sp. SK-3]|uniref:cell envelope integrity protein TolA n=1 Tax=Cupriavidus sp. SK-3 TaxID=1470558 RepID=UPI000449E04D|nr:cell envelope integrity protein TolA [Cupriavidus sp. SK-3]KDP87203.1 energy transducer TonB [Cupriavidus sp. SK-3]